ncbi:hypothetical protein NQ318_003644 [Aromia moschata]|uniref:Uncharacterized protein n=1 Tax=Aromia moschata TaxID=1265417 RepID=A0AAV8Y142_9CUCU|nr:hypothetical protein NQ318_003644 [Aromia moschata]
MDILDERTETEVVSKTLDCLTLLTFTRAGEQMAQDINLLEILNRYLHDERPEVHTSAASTIMYCTVKTKAKITASKIDGLAKRLLDLCQNSLNSSTQIYAIKLKPYLV